MIVPRTAIPPLARSIPAVRMIIVWPIASVPTITLCWTTSERLPDAQNVRVVTENTAQNAIKTTSGPNVGVATTRPNPPAVRFGLAALIRLIDPFPFRVLSLLARNKRADAYGVRCLRASRAQNEGPEPEA